MILINEARWVLLIQIKLLLMRFLPLVFENSWKPWSVCLADNPIYFLDQNFQFWLRHKSQDVGLVHYSIELYSPQKVLVFVLKTELSCTASSIIESKVHDIIVIVFWLTVTSACPILDLLLLLNLIHCCSCLRVTILFFAIKYKLFIYI